MLADKENTEQIDNLIAQSLRAIAMPKITSDDVKRRFSQDIQAGYSKRKYCDLAAETNAKR